MTENNGDYKQTALSGLYAITDEHLIKADAMLGAVTQAIQGGCRIVQYRNKSDDHELRFQQASALQSLCKQQQVIFIINDDIELAIKVAADGVHLGKHDGDLLQARQALGRNRIIGVSCYNEFSLAVQAQKSGADYVAFGSFFPSGIKPDAVRADIGLLKRARQEINVPVVAIGGIQHHHARGLIAAGADMLAVISALFTAEDISDSAARFSACFASSRS